MIDHEPFRFLAAKDVGDQTTPAEAVELEAHLAGCPTCSADAALLRRDHLALVASLVDAPVAPRVRGRVVAAVENDRRGGWVLPVLVAAALLLAALLAAGLFVAAPRPAPAPDPFAGVWQARDSVIVHTVSFHGSGPNRLVEVVEEVSERCGGDLAFGAGSGAILVPGVIEGEFSRVVCRDGSDATPFSFRYTHDLAADLLADESGVIFARSSRASPSVVAPSTSPSAVPASVTAPTTTPVVPTVTGSFTYVLREGAAGRSVSIDAAGMDPVVGTWSFQALPDGAVQSGSVTCLVLVDNEAFVFGAPARAGERAAFIWLQDGDGPGGAGDRAVTWMQDLASDPLPPDVQPQTQEEMRGWCQNAGEGFPGAEDPGTVPLTTGELTITP
jgi:hypothetical protein